MSTTPNANGLVQDPSVPTKWNYLGDPTYNWADLGEQPQYTTDIALGVNPNTGTGGVFVHKDIYDKLGWIKRRGDSQTSRGYQGEVIVNVTSALTAASSGKLIRVLNENTTRPAVVVTLPSRADMMTAGATVETLTNASPWFTASSGVVLPMIIEGYTADNGTPLSVTVNNTTTTANDYPQFIFVPGSDRLTTNYRFDTIYLYDGEYAELVPRIIVSSGATTYDLIWELQIHQSGYGRVGQYVQVPPSVLPAGQIKADNSSKTRAQYPRLWQIINSPPFNTAGLVAQGSKTAAVYGTGNGTSTFTLPDMSGSADAALIQHNIIY